MEANPPLAPLGELGWDIFAEKEDLSVATNELAFLGAGFGDDERDVRAAICGCDLDPALPRVKAAVHHHAEPQLVQVEAQAAFLIANVNEDDVET